MKYSKAKPLLDVTTGRSPIYHLYSLSISSFTNRSDQSDLAPPDWFGHFQLKSPEQSPGCGVLPFLPLTPLSQLLCTSDLRTCAPLTQRWLGICVSGTRIVVTFLSLYFLCLITYWTLWCNCKKPRVLPTYVKQHYFQLLIEILKNR